MPFENGWLVVGGAVPVLVGAVALFVWLQPWRPLSRYSTALGWAVATADGFWVGYFLHVGRQKALPLPPIEADQWLAVAALPAAVLVEAVALSERVPRWLGWTLRLLALAAVPVMIAPATLQGRAPTGSKVVELAVIIALLVAVRAALGVLAARTESRAPWWPMLIAVAGAGVLILSSGSIKLGQAALSVAAAMLGVRIASAFIKGPMPLQAGLSVAFTMLAGWLLAGYWYAAVNAWHGAALVLAPLAAWVLLLPWVRRRRPWQAALIAAGVAAVVIGAVVAPAVIEAERAAAADPYSGY